MKIKTFLLVMLSVISMAAFGQQKKIALLEPRVGEGSTGITSVEKSMVRGELRKAIVNNTEYEAVSRTDMDQIMKEQNFQRTGMVSEAQIKKLGELSGADYICVSTLSKENDEFYLEAVLINVETGQISNTASQYGELTDGSLSNMMPACQALVTKLVESINKSNVVIKITVGNIKFDMVMVAAGTFKKECVGRRSKCMVFVTQNITISKNYFIGRFEVTQKLYEAVMDTNPSHQKSPDRPVENVSWDDAQEFCAKLSRLTGRHFSLPTEAEWEYAARGGKKSTNTEYSGNSTATQVAWYYNNSKYETHPVGQLQPNELSLYDMSGNVWEWCQDWYDCCSSNKETDPSGPNENMGYGHVIRGGGVDYSAVCCQLGYRHYEYRKSNFVGFRVVCH